MEGDNDILYRECLRNHAASLGSYATDGCGEFIPDDSTPGAACSSSFNCAACGCHRNFHRKVSSSSGGVGWQQAAEYSPETSSKKRFRTKFTDEQKEQMLVFAEKLGWRMQRKDEEDEIEKFCRGVGISRKVFKVWMHNHKNNTSHSAASNGNAASSLTDQ